jgi:hypothetical protein
MNEEQPTPEQPAEAQPLETQSPDPRRRLRELLAVPERDRSDAVWDEIASLEIELAPGNRVSSTQGDPGRSQEPARRQEQGRRPEHARRQQQPGAQPGKRFFQRPRRGPRPPNKP